MISPTRARFLIAASTSMLAACGGGVGTLPHHPRTATFDTVDPTGDGSSLPPCTSPQQTGCTNPDTGLVQIGSVTARTSNYSWQTSWDPEGIGGSGMYYDGYTRQFAQNLAQCTYDQGAEIASAAFGLAVYLRDHGSELQSAAADIITYARVYLAGGATAAEFFLAAGAVLSIGDWALVLTAIGMGGYEAGKLIRCAALGAGST